MFLLHCKSILVQFNIFYLLRIRYSLLVYYSVHFCITIFVLQFFQFLLYSNICTAEMALPSTPVNSIPNHGEKPERFNGTDFKR